MALTVLLADLRRLHHWRLALWHGNHGWRAEAAQQAGELQAWAHSQELPFLLEQAKLKSHTLVAQEAEDGIFESKTCPHSKKTM